MAQNVFDATFDANNRIDVNSFDWSHVNNLTTNFLVFILLLVFFLHYKDKEFIVNKVLNDR